MENILVVVAIIGLSFGLLVSPGCTKKAASSSDAIQSSQTLKTVQEKTDYLMKQAQAFYDSKDFQQAIKTAQYILSNLDKNSQPAKDLIEKAKAQLQAAAQQAAGNVTNKLFGK